MEQELMKEKIAEILYEARLGFLLGKMSFTKTRKDV